MKEPVTIELPKRAFVWLSTKVTEMNFRVWIAAAVAIGLAIWAILDPLVGRVLDVIATLLVVYVLFEVFAGGRDSRR